MSSYSKKTFIVFLDLPDEICRKIDNVRGKYSSSGVVYKSHITLKQDEDYSINSDRLMNIVHHAISKERPFQVKIQKISSAKSDLGWNIYLPIDSKRLKKLIVKLSKILMVYVDPASPRALLSTKWEQSEDFYLHISIKGASDRVKFEKLYENIKNENFNLNFPEQIICNKVVVARWENSKWKAINTIELKNV